MREGWEKTQLGNVTQQVIDPVELDPDRTYINLGVKWYAAGTFLREPKAGAEIKAKRLFRVRPGQFVYNRLFATEGSFALVRPSDEHAVASNEFPVFSVDTSRLMPEYLYLHFQQPSVWQEVNRQCTGTTKSRLRWKEDRFAAHGFALPPLPEQRRIVGLIGALDETIAGGQSSYRAAAEARLALCRAAQSTAAPTLISEIAEVSQGKSFPKASQGVTTGDTPWFKIADMAQAHNVHGYVRAETALSVSEIVRLGGVIIQPGAVVFPRVGAAVLTEKKRLILVPGAVDENHLVLTPLEGVGSDLLLTVMDNLRLSGLVQSGAVPSLNMGLVRATAVQWPTERAAELDAVLGDFRRSLEAGATLLQRLTLLRSNFLASLLSGEHEIPESYDELMGEAS